MDPPTEQTLLIMATHDQYQAGPVSHNPARSLTVLSQVTDDSELALCLAHGLAGSNEPPSSTPPLDDIAKWYGEWINSPPFDIGNVPGWPCSAFVLASGGRKVEAGIACYPKKTLFGSGDLEALQGAQAAAVILWYTDPRRRLSNTPTPGYEM